MSNPQKILGRIDAGTIRILDLSGIRTHWDIYRRDGSTAGLDSFDDLVELLVERRDALSSVEEVRLAESELDELPAFLDAMPRLKVLDLYRNNFEALPSAEALARFPQLESLRLNENRITHLSESVLQLTSLRSLDLGNNPKLSELPTYVAKLESLSRLSIIDTGIRHVPLEVIEMESLEVLDWRKVPLETIAGIPTKTIPNGVIASGLSAFRAYRHELGDGPAQPGDEVKVVVVGDGGAGKTTLLDNLHFNPRPYSSGKRDSTPGLKIHTRLGFDELDRRLERAVRVNAWDFGGQGPYRFAQQLFCTPGAVYIFVTTPPGVRSEAEPYGHTYWLRMIAALSDPETQEAGAIVHVVTHANPDGSSDRPGPSRAAGLAKSVCELFPNVSAPFPVSFLRDTGFEGARDAIFSRISRAKTAHANIPYEWRQVRDILRELTQPGNGEPKRRSISIDEYELICAENGLPDQGSMKGLLEYLNESGALLHFANIQAARNRLHLDPDWIRDAVFAVLDYDGAIERGWIQESDLEALRRERGLSRTECDELVLTMRELGLCYYDKKRQLDVFPALLPARPEETPPPSTDGPAVSVHWRFRPLLPAGFLVRYMASRYDGSNFEPEWRDSVVLDFDRAHIELTEHWQRHEVLVRISGPDGLNEFLGNVRRRMLAICDDFREIGMKSLEVIEELPCSCSVCRASETAAMLPLDYVLGSESGRLLLCRNQGRPARAEILGGYTLSPQDDPSARTLFLSFRTDPDGVVADEWEHELTHRRTPEFKGARIRVIKQEGNPTSLSTEAFIQDVSRADGLLLFKSVHSMSSRWVHLEIREALQSELPIFVVAVDSSAFDEDLEQRARDEMLRALAELRSKPRSDTNDRDIEQYEIALENLSRHFLALADPTQKGRPDARSRRTRRSDRVGLSSDHGVDVIEAISLQESRAEVFAQAEAHNAIAVRSLYPAPARRLLARPGALGKAALATMSAGWLRPLWNDPDALLELIDALPTSPIPKFCALPSFAFEATGTRWPSISVLEHRLFELEGGTGSRPPTDTLEPADVGELAEAQPYLDEYGGADYLAHVAEHEPTACIREHGRLVGWGWVHEDRTIGALRVDATSRRRGLGRRLARDLASRLRARGERAVGHVSPWNPASLALMNSVGATDTLQVDGWARERSNEDLEAFRSGRF